jgi:hypothetical protein
MDTTNYFARLNQINISAHIEKKDNSLIYHGLML